MKILVLHDNPCFASEIEYTFCVLCSVTGLSFESITANEADCLQSLIETGGYSLAILYYRDQFPQLGIPSVRIHASDFFGDKYLQPCSLPSLDVRPSTKDGLAAIYLGGTAMAEPFSMKTELFVETNVDVIASSFFLLTCYQEYLSSAQDRFGRFPAEESFLYRAGYLTRPLVNEYADWLFDSIVCLVPGAARRTAWRDSNFAFCLTHDVDSLRKYDTSREVREIARTLAKGHPRYGIRLLCGLSERLLKNRVDPYDTFDYLRRIADEHKLKSTYYFLVHPQDGVGGGGYGPTDSTLLHLLRSLTTTGSELALHTSYDVHSDEAAMHAEWQSLNEAFSYTGVTPPTTMGCRQHFLRWQTPESWSARSAAGFRYDSSVLFASQLGFRCGLCVPFRPYNLRTREMLSIYEVPPTLMDGTLSDYLALPPESGVASASMLLEEIVKHKGVFTLIWHNSHLSEHETPGWRSAFEEIVGAIVENKPFAETVQSVLDAWDSQMGLAYLGYRGNRTYETLRAAEKTSFRDQSASGQR